MILNVNSIVQHVIQIKKGIMITAWKVSKHGVISGPYIPVFSPNTGKNRPEVPPYLDTFHALDKYLCDGKKYCKCERDYSWNTNTYICKNGRFLSITDTSVIVCDKIINATDSVSTDVTNTISTNLTNVMSTVSINSHDEKIKI